MIYSLANGGNTDIYRTDLATGQNQRLTNTPAIETAPSFSPTVARLYLRATGPASSSCISCQKAGVSRSGFPLETGDMARRCGRRAGI